MTESEQHDTTEPLQQHADENIEQPEEPPPSHMRLDVAWHTTCNAVRRLNLYGVQGVPSRQRPGLIGIWYYGLSLSAAGAFFGSYITLYLLAVGATQEQVGWLAAGANFLGFLAPMLGAMLARRWGNPRVIVAIFVVLRRVPLLLAALSPFVFSGQTLIVVLILLFALRLALLSVYTPAFVSLMAAVIPEGIRGRYLGARKMVMALASVMLVPLAGWLIDTIGEPVGYQVTLAIGFLVGIAGAYGILMIPDYQIADSVKAERGAGGSLLSAVTGNRTFALYVLVRLFFNFVWQVGGPYFAVYQKEILMSSTQLIGILVTVSAITRLIGERFWGTIVDRKGERWVLVFCALIIPVLPFIWIVATKPWHIVFVSLPSGFLWAGFNMGALNLQMTLPKPQYRTQGAAVHLMAVRIGNIVGPLVGTVLIQHLGYRWNFALSGIGRLIAALMLVALLKPFTENALLRTLREWRLSAAG